MTKRVSAIFENGVFRPLSPVGLAEHEHVALTIEAAPTPSEIEEMLDLEFLAELEGEDLDDIPLETVRQALSKIPGSMTADFIAEREERF